MENQSKKIIKSNNKVILKKKSSSLQKLISAPLTSADVFSSPSSPKYNGFEEENEEVPAAAQEWKTTKGLNEKEVIEKLAASLSSFCNGETNKTKNFDIVANEIMKLIQNNHIWIDEEFHLISHRLLGAILYELSPSGILKKKEKKQDKLDMLSTFRGNEDMLEYMMPTDDDSYGYLDYYIINHDMESDDEIVKLLVEHLGKDNMQINVIKT